MLADDFALKILKDGCFVLSNILLLLDLLFQREKGDTCPKTDMRSNTISLDKQHVENCASQTLDVFNIICSHPAPPYPVVFH